MISRKLEQLFGAARARPPVPPPAGFASGVRRAIQHEGPPRVTASWLDQLGALFPRVAAAAVIVIIAAAAFEFWSGTDISAQFCDASEQLLLPVDGL